MPSDLLMLAVRYLSNELPDDELAAFEDLLECDQAAREAVADAVALSLAVSRLPQSMGPERVLPLHRRRVGPGKVVALAAAACLLIALGLALTLGRGRGGGDAELAVVPVESSPAPPESVALAWSGLLESEDLELTAQNELPAWLDEPISLAAATAVGDGGLTASSTRDDELLPCWLVEAASLGESAALPGTGPREN